MISSSELSFEVLCYSPDRDVPRKIPPRKPCGETMAGKTELVGLRDVTLKENTHNAEYLIYL